MALLASHPDDIDDPAPQFAVVLSMDASSTFASYVCDCIADENAHDPFDIVAEIEEDLGCPLALS